MNEVNDSLKNFKEEIHELVLKIKDALIERHEMVATAESCTGGLIASSIVNESGSSAILKGGIIAYQNEIKSSILKVPETILSTKGAVCAETVEAMAKGAIKLFNCEWAVSTSGIAGPSGAEPGKPVGTVWMCIANRQMYKTFYNIFSGNREKIREKSVYRVLSELLFLINKQKSTCTNEH